jgi:LuxR family transcriptional regulator, quorum-sensing system regulator CinR
MDTDAANEAKLRDALSIVAQTPDMDQLVAALRDFLAVDHLVYHSSKRGASPSVDPYIRLTYPADWIKRYLQMGYVDVDPVLREGFLRTLPFDWSEVEIRTNEEASFIQDAFAHGVGPFGLSIPLRSKSGHRGLFSISFSRSESDWMALRASNLDLMIEVANRIHRRVIKEIFGEDQPHLSAREIDCMRLIATGKDAVDIAQILGISPHTARDYLKSARFKLDCVTSAQAVSKAVKLGLLIL